MGSGEYRAAGEVIGKLQGALEHLTKGFGELQEQRREWEVRAHAEDKRRALAEQDIIRDLARLAEELGEVKERLQRFEDELLDVGPSPPSQRRKRAVPAPVHEEEAKARTGLWRALAVAAGLVGSALAGWLAG